MIGIPLISHYIHRVVKPQVVADSVDYLNYYCTSLLLAFFALAISAKQYFGSPIQCFVPNEFKGSWERYTEDYCFIQNSYYVPIESDIPNNPESRRDQISYYRWVPIVLALQALLFFIPNYLWNMLYKDTAIQPRAIIKDALKCSGLHADRRDSEVRNLAEYIADTVAVFTPRNCYGKKEVARSGNNAALLYLLTKFFYLANIIAQLYLMNHFLGGGYLSWGLETWVALAHGQDWTDSPIFPRVIMCDFTIRGLADQRNYTVQCVIMMNMINEKLYLFLWIWLLFVGICTIINFLYYLFLMCVPYARIRLVLWNISKQQLKSNGLVGGEIRRFIQDFLRLDGVLMIKFIQEHVNGRISRELVTELIKIYAQSGQMFRPRLDYMYSLPMQLRSPGTGYESAPVLEDYIDGGDTLPIGEIARTRATQRAPSNENEYGGSPAQRQITPTQV
uniref:Innexin n=1 Tax=Syphacia muris TaxID=451379 RepID=A0A0N5A9L6_9BILA